MNVPGRIPLAAERLDPRTGKQIASRRLRRPVRVPTSPTALDPEGCGLAAGRIHSARRNRMIRAVLLFANAAGEAGKAHPDRLAIRFREYSDKLWWSTAFVRGEC